MYECFLRLSRSMKQMECVGSDTMLDKYVMLVMDVTTVLLARSTWKD